MRLTNNFWLSEFNCNDGTSIPEYLIPKVLYLAKELQKIRDEIMAPLYINSAYRTETYNKKVGGSTKSQHKLAKAADLVCPELNPEQLYTLIDNLMIGGFIKNGGLGRYNTFTHYDIRDCEARWDKR